MVGWWWWGWDPGRLCTDSCRIAGILMGRGLKSSQHRGDTTELELEWNLKLISSSFSPPPPLLLLPSFIDFSSAIIYFCFLRYLTTQKCTLLFQINACLNGDAFIALVLCCLDHIICPNHTPTHTTTHAAYSLVYLTLPNVS